jgi:serine/threonine protein kinase
MGTVYLGQDRTTGTEVAIKIVKADAATMGSITARFRREIQISKQFAHPYVIKIIDGGIHAEYQLLYLVMEFLSGESLGDCCLRSPLNSKTARTVMTHVAQALSYIHERGIIHRDIKPDNILIVSPERTVLLDFGLALVEDSTRLSKTSDRAGTWVTMSPEQISGHELDGRSDIYSLGVTMYWAVTGKIPFCTEDIVRMSAGIGPDLSTLLSPESLPHLDRRLLSIIKKSMAFDREDRFADGDELFKALAETTNMDLELQTMDLRAPSASEIISGSGRSLSPSVSSSSGRSSGSKSLSSSRTSANSAIKDSPESGLTVGRESFIKKLRLAFILGVVLIILFIGGARYFSNPSSANSASANLRSASSASAVSSFASSEKQEVSLKDVKVHGSEENSNLELLLNSTSRVAPTKEELEQIKTLTGRLLSSETMPERDDFQFLGDLFIHTYYKDQFDSLDDELRVVVGSYFYGVSAIDGGLWQRAFKTFKAFIDEYGCDSSTENFNLFLFLVNHHSQQNTTYAESFPINSDVRCAILDYIEYSAFRANVPDELISLQRKELEKVEGSADARGSDKVSGSTEAGATAGILLRKMALARALNRKFYVTLLQNRVKELDRSLLSEPLSICRYLASQKFNDEDLGLWLPVYFSILEEINTDESRSEGTGFFRKVLAENRVSRLGQVVLYTAMRSILRPLKRLGRKVTTGEEKLLQEYALKALQIGREINYFNLPFLYANLGSAYRKTSKNDLAYPLFSSLPYTEDPYRFNYNFIYTFGGIFADVVKHKEAVKIMSTLLEADKTRGYLCEIEKENLSARIAVYNTSELLFGGFSMGQ